MPHRLEVRCPECAGRAEFEFAELRRIERRDDVAFFQEHPHFLYRQYADGCGHLWHGALYFAGLSGDPRRVLDGLPEGYAPCDWLHSRYLSRSHGQDIGSIDCPGCGLRRRHELAWPGDAWYLVAHRGHLLWAFHRESALELLDYLQSSERNLRRYRWRAFLLHVPTPFKVRKARDAVCRQLLRLLG
ncbi:MAG: hypothetical protein GAK43_00556 [Stenotrophomonas maltophilia]|nr:MAG: hypothetical protein GAK43_00556 [Stenotrophomonas maltophilia]